MTIITLHNLALDATKLPQVTLDPGGSVMSSVLKFLFALIGAIAMLVIAIAGFRYTISRGDANSIKTSKETIIYAAIGLAIAISGYSIVNVVLNGIK